MSFLILEAYFTLIRFERLIACGDFARLYGSVRNSPRRDVPAGEDSVERICAAVDLASIWYWKEILCLQRSATTACLLKRYGIPAQMVIGAQLVPFRAHAWVEVGERIVNDKPYVAEIYTVLDRC